MDQLVGATLMGRACNMISKSEICVEMITLLLCLHSQTPFVILLGHRQQPQQSGTVAKLRSCTHTGPPQSKVRRSLQQRHVSCCLRLVFTASCDDGRVSIQKTFLQRCVLFIFCSVNPDVGGGGGFIETQVVIVICFHASQNAKAMNSNFFPLLFFASTETRSTLRPTVLPLCRGRSHSLKVFTRMQW